MANSYVQYVGDGVTRVFNLTFPYISQDHVKVRVNGTPVTFTFVTSSTIQLPAAPLAGAVVDVRRITPTDQQLVEFQNGSVLVAEDLNGSSTQEFFIAQESADTANAAITYTPFGVHDAHGKRLTNLADPIDPQDAVTKAYHDQNYLPQITAAVAATAADKVAADASALAAANSATSAQGYSTSAGNHATNALASKNAADADAVATAADRAAVATDKATVAADKATVASDKATVHTDRLAADADAAATAADRVAVAADKVTTQGYKDAAATSATAAHNSELAAATSATSADASKTAAAASAVAAQASADAASAAAGGGAVKISSTDTASGYVKNKLVAGSNVTLTQNNTGGNETLTIAVNGLGSAAYQNTSAFATAAQGTKADGALQAGNNLSDITNQGTARTNLGLGSAATLASDTDGTLATNSDTKVSTQKAVKTYVDGQVTALNSFAVTTRDQIALTNLRLLLNSSVSSGALVQGKQWELATDEWGSTSSSYQFLSGTPGAYSGYQVNVAKGKTPTQSTGTPYSGHEAIYACDGDSNTYARFNCAGSIYVVGGLDMGAATPVDVRRLCITMDSTVATTTGVDLVYSTDGSNWTVLQSFTIAANSTRQVLDVTNASPGSKRYWGWRYYNLTDPAWKEVEMYTTTANYLNMVLVPPSAVTLASAPTYADCFFLWKDDSGSAVLGTDLTVELSRDNGTSWTTATITDLLGTGGFDGTYSVLRARANVSGQPSGTSLKARIKTLNSKAQRVAAPAIYAE